MNGAVAASPSRAASGLATRRVNPDTRLVDVFVSLPESAGLLLEDFVSGRLNRRSAERGWSSPREAVLPAEDGFRPVHR